MSRRAPRGHLLALRAYRRRIAALVPGTLAYTVARGKDANGLSRRWDVTTRPVTAGLIKEALRDDVPYPVVMLTGSKKRAKAWAEMLNEGGVLLGEFVP